MATKKKTDLYLTEVFKHFISLKDDDFKKSQEVFKCVLVQVKEKMGQQCNFFAKYSKQVMYAGSVYDGIKVSKLDEFDMDIVINLPISYEDGEKGIIVEPEQPGFVKMKIVDGFDTMPKRAEWETCHKVTLNWRDSDKYFLQNKFRQWMQGIVTRAVKELKGEVDVNGIKYLITYKEAGPAFTLNIRNNNGDEEFKLDVDLVPVIRFQHPRWPPGYREVKDFTARDWLVVPKPHKGLKSGVQEQCWRLSFQEFEREMMKGCQNLKMTIRLVKKLRDRFSMKAIASYYIKTLFLWQVHEQKENKTYWRTKVSTLFEEMVEKLYTAIDEQKIKYFWMEENNLLERANPNVLTNYARDLNKVLDCLRNKDEDSLVELLLTKEELEQFKASQFYDKLPRSVSVLDPVPKQRQNNGQKEEPGSNLIELVKNLIDKVACLTEKLEMQDERLKILERERDFYKKKSQVDDEDDIDPYVSPKRIKCNAGNKVTPKGLDDEVL